MDTYNIAICDDDPVFRQMMLLQLENYSDKSGVKLNTDAFCNGLELLISENNYCTIFLDYRMGIMNGVETAKKLRGKGIKCPIVFVTTEGEEVKHEKLVGGVVHTLMKPIESELLKIVLDEIISEYRSMHTITISANGLSVSVLTDEITYIKSSGREDCTVHTDTASYFAPEPMQELAERVRDNTFVQCSHSCMVNLRHVKNVNMHTITLCSGETIKLGYINAKAFYKAYSDFSNGGA